MEDRRGLDMFDLQILMMLKELSVSLIIIEEVGKNFWHGFYLSGSFRLFYFYFFF